MRLYICLCRNRFLATLTTIVLVSCGGGGGAGGTGVAPRSPAPAPPPEPTIIVVSDSQPQATAGPINPAMSTVNIAHVAHDDLITSVSGCDDISVNSVKRSMSGLSTADMSTLLHHRITCNLGENDTYDLIVDGDRQDGSRFRSTVRLSTGVRSEFAVTTLDQQTLTKHDVSNLFAGYVAGALLNDLTSILLSSY